MGIGERFEFEKTGRIDPEPGTLQARAKTCVFKDGFALTAVKDMLLGKDAADRRNKTLCRAVKRMQAKLRGRAETIRRLLAESEANRREAESCAASCRMAHLGGGFGGGSAEGVGCGATAAQALANCCFTGQRVCIASSVRQGSNGRWYAVKIFW